MTHPTSDLSAEINPHILMTKDQFERMDKATDGELSKWAERMEHLVKAAEAPMMLNEQPCGCHDDPTYGHVIMGGCPLHD